MVEATATVVEVKAGQALLRIAQRPGGCGRCNEPGGCQSVQLTHALGTQKEFFALPDTIGVQAGDIVRIVMDERAPLYAAILSYGLAAGLLLIGAAAGLLIAGSGAGDLPVVAGGITGVALAIIINRMIYRSRSWRDRLRMSMRRDDSSCVRKAGSLT